MLTIPDKKQLTKIRKIVLKELKRLRVSEPKISIACDYRTKKARLCYSVYEDKGIDTKGGRKIRKKQKYLYLKNVTIYDEDVIKINMTKYVDEKFQLIRRRLIIGLNYILQLINDSEILN